MTGTKRDKSGTCPGLSRDGTGQASIDASRLSRQKARLVRINSVSQRRPRETHLLGPIPSSWRTCFPPAYPNFASNERLL